LWSPDDWTTIAHNPIAREHDFEMIYLQLIKKPPYVIYNEYGYDDTHNLHYSESSDTIALISRIIAYFYEHGYDDTHNLHYSESSDTIALISRIIAYFYEHFTVVKFKLFTNLSKTIGEFRGLCYLSAKISTHKGSTLHTANYTTRNYYPLQ